MAGGDVEGEAGGGKGREGGGSTYIPSIEAVRLPTGSLPVQSQETGREEFSLYVHTGRNHNHTGHVCVCV